jgi:hypothetical protein
MDVSISPQQEMPGRRPDNILSNLPSEKEKLSPPIKKLQWRMQGGRALRSDEKWATRGRLLFDLDNVDVGHDPIPGGRVVKECSMWSN